MKMELRSSASVPLTITSIARGLGPPGGCTKPSAVAIPAPKPDHAASSPTITAAESYQAIGACASATPGVGSIAGATGSSSCHEPAVSPASVHGMPPASSASGT